MQRWVGQVVEGGVAGEQQGNTEGHSHVLLEDKIMIELVHDFNDDLATSKKHLKQI